MGLTAAADSRESWQDEGLGGLEVGGGGGGRGGGGSSTLSFSLCGLFIPDESWFLSSTGVSSGIDGGGDGYVEVGVGGLGGGEVQNDVGEKVQIRSYSAPPVEF